MKQLHLYTILGIILTLLYSCNEVKDKKSITIIRQFTSIESGVTGREYHLFLTQEEVDNFIRRKTDELKRPLPISDTPKIFPNEMCLFVFWGTIRTVGFHAENIVEEHDRILFRVYASAYQTLSESEIDEKTGEKKITSISGAPKEVTPFGWFILPRTNKKLVIQNDLPPHEIGVHNWQTVKEFNPR